MKKLLLILLVLAAGISLLFALPLTATIFQESAKLRAKFDLWNKQCGNKPDYDEPCSKRRHALSKELGDFVALVNDELSFIAGPVSPNAPADFVKEAEGRRKIMEHEVRVTLHDLKCLGVSDPQCHEEAAAIEAEKVTLESEYKETHARFDGQWISLRVKKVIPQGSSSKR
jgi:hypothetical protein